MLVVVTTNSNIKTKNLFGFWIESRHKEGGGKFVF